MTSRECDPQAFKNPILKPQKKQQAGCGVVSSATLRILLHCASLLRITSRVIGECTLKHGDFFFKTGAPQRGKSSFFLKRVR